MAISLMMAVTTNTFREEPLPWIEGRRLIKSGDKFPYFPLSAGEISHFKAYLGLPPDKEIITIADIQTELLVFEVLNAFCFPCQTHALTLTKAHKAIEERPDLKGRIKILGVALGNTETITKGFINDYGVAFPVISDPEALADKILGPAIHVPFTLFIRRDASGKPGLVVETHTGAIEDPRVLLNTLDKLLNMKPGAVKNPELL